MSDNNRDIVLSNKQSLSKYSSDIVKKGLELAKKLDLVDFSYSLELDAEEYYQIGLDHKQKENYQDAIENFSKTLYLDPDHYFAYIERGEIYGKIGEKRQAIEDYTQAFNIHSGDYFARLARGNLFLEIGEFKRAISDYNSAIEVDEYEFRDEEIYIKRGFAYSLIDEETEAISNFAIGMTLSDYFSEMAFEDVRESLKDNQPPDKIQEITYLFMLAKAGFYYIQKDFEESIEIYTSIIHENFRVDEAYNNRGIARLALGDLLGAIEDYNRSININANNIQPYINRGSAYLTLGKLQEALVDFERVVKLDPNSAQSYFNRGLVKQKQQRFQEALADFDIALKQDPEHIYSWFHKGWLYSFLYGHFIAMECFEKAKKINREKTLEYYYEFADSTKRNLKHNLTNQINDQLAFDLLIATINQIGDFLNQ